MTHMSTGYDYPFLMALSTWDIWLLCFIFITYYNNKNIQLMLFVSSDEHVVHFFTTNIFYLSTTYSSSSIVPLNTQDYQNNIIQKNMCINSLCFSFYSFPLTLSGWYHIIIPNSCHQNLNIVPHQNLHMKFIPTIQFF